MTLEKTPLMKSMEAEAKTLRVELPKLKIERERLPAFLSIYAAEHEALAASVDYRGCARGNELSLLRGEAANRLRQVNGEIEDGEKRLRVLDDRLEAGPRAEKARVSLRQLIDAVNALVQQRHTASQSVEKLRVLQRDHSARADAGVNSRAAELLASVGVEGAGSQADRPAIDAAVHEREGRALDEALTIATRKVEQVDRDIDTASQAVEAARGHLATQLAVLAELRHAEALSEYLPRFAEYAAAHSRSHGWQPSAPDIKQMIAGAMAPAIEAFAAQLTDEVMLSASPKAAKAVKGQAS